jgi:hypothetical protein
MRQTKNHFSHRKQSMTSTLARIAAAAAGPWCLLK